MSERGRDLGYRKNRRNEMTFFKAAGCKKRAEMQIIKIKLLKLESRQ